MKPRRVFVTVEMESDAPLEVLRDPRVWGWHKGRAIPHFARVLQLQANVARYRGPKLPKRKRR